MRPAREADSSEVLVVPNVKVRMEVQHFIPHLSLRNLLREKVYLNTKMGLLLDQKLQFKNLDKNLKPRVFYNPRLVNRCQLQIFLYERIQFEITLE